MQKVMLITGGEMGPIAVMVNNAATLEKQMRLESMDAGRMHRMFATNIIGHHRTNALCERSCAPNVHTTRRIFGLAREVAEEGIRVAGVRPGFICTDLYAKGGEPNRVDRVKALVPMKRGGQPEEVAAAILWLASEEASYVTGTDVSGGR